MKKPRLTKDERDTLAALADPGARTFIGGFNVVLVFDLERRGLLQSKPHPILQSFLEYSITDAGRAALSNGQSREVGQ